MSTYQPPYNFQAVYRAYPEVMLVDDEKGAFDKDNNEVVLEQSKIDTALAEIQALERQNAYQSYRRMGLGSTAGYPSVESQLDQLYHDMADGKLGVAATTGSWYVGITSIKTTFKKGEY